LPLTAIVYKLCVMDHIRIQISQFVCSCDLFEGLLKFIIIIIILIFVLQILYDISEIWFIIFSHTFIPTQHVACPLSFLFPLRSQFQMSLLKPSITVRQSHTELNLDIILDVCSRSYSISKDLHTVTNSKRRTLSWETSVLFSKFRTFMEPNFLSKFAHQTIPSTAHCRKPYESSPHRHTPVSIVILILFSHIGLGFQMLYLLRVLEIKFVWTFSSLTRGMAHASHPPWFDHTNNIWFKLCRVSICSSLQPPVTSPLLGLDILLGTQFKNTKFKSLSL
jgi:hypothetical protein